jgi:uracil-DNA glycosylase family 4
VADSLDQVRQEVIACARCPRLVRYRSAVARERKREFRDQEYWGRGVPGFGDPAARLVVVGLAPAAHGSNRTGRVFTGDRSAAFLVRALHRAGFASQPTSLQRNDGLRYRDLYVTSAVRCVPPDNRPRPDEWAHCRSYLEEEMAALPNLQAILALGAFAWSSVLDAAGTVWSSPVDRSAFAHGGCVALGAGRPLVYASYHPSPQNTNTNRLTEQMLAELLSRIRAGWARSDVPPPPA